MYNTGIRPVSEYAMGLHGVAPSEMERVEQLAMRALSPTTKGESRTAKLAYHLEPVADAQIARTIQLIREMWRTRPGATDTLPIGGSEGLHEVWTTVMCYDQGWPKARGQHT